MPELFFWAHTGNAVEVIGYQQSETASDWQKPEELVALAWIWAVLKKVMKLILVFSSLPRPNRNPPFDFVSSDGVLKLSLWDQPFDCVEKQRIWGSALRLEVSRQYLAQCALARWCSQLEGIWYAANRHLS